MTPGSRSQSEVVGVVLLVGVVVTLVFTIGVVLVPGFVAESDEPLVTIDAEATTQNVTIWHSEGEKVATEDLEVILWGENRERYAFESFTQLKGSDSTVFEPGDKWLRSHRIDGDRMEILLIDTEAGEILDREQVDIEDTLAARFETNVTNPTTLDTIRFDASGSRDPEGTVANYSWDFDDGTELDADPANEVVNHSFDSPGSYDVTLTVRSDDGRTATQTRTIEVFSPSPNAAFTVESEDADRTLSFDAADSEPGDPDGRIVNYTWKFGDGEAIVDGSESETHTYDSNGEYTVTLIVEDDNNETDQASQQVVVGPFFAVENFSAQDSVAQGTEIQATATVENTGSAADTQMITYNVSGETRNATSTTLAAGESTTVELNWTVPYDFEGGDYSHGVYSDNDSDTGTLTVLEVDGNVDLQDEISRGDDSFDVTTSNFTNLDPSDGGYLVVENNATGATETFDGVGETTVTVDSLDFDGGEELIATLYPEAGTDAVLDNDTTTVAAANLTVEDLSVADATTSEEVTVTVPVTESADVETANLSVSLELTDDDGVVVEERLEPGEISDETIEVSFDVGTLDAGSYVATVTADADNAAPDSNSDSFTVLQEPSFEVTIDRVEDSVTAGDTVTVDYTVENTGDIRDTQEIVFEVNGTEEGSESDVTLDGGETFSEQFTYTTDSGDTPAIEIAVSSDNETATETVTVSEGAGVLELVELRTVDTELVFRIENTGGEEVTVEEFAVDATAVEPGMIIDDGGEDASEFEIKRTDVQNGEASRVGSFDADGTRYDLKVDSDGDAGQYATLAADDDDVDVDLRTFRDADGNEFDLGGLTAVEDESDADVNVTLVLADGSEERFHFARETPTFEVTIDDIDQEVVEGEDLTAAVTVENVGDARATQTVEFRDFDGTIVDSKDVSLAKGESTSLDLVWETESGNAGTGNVTIASETDSATREVTVLEPAFFEVTVDDSPAEVADGDEITVDYTVENIGGAEDTQDIVFDVDGSQVDVNASVTLGAGDVTSGTFTYTTGRNDIPEVSINISSDDDFETETVDVVPRLRLYNAQSQGGNPANSEVTFQVENQASEVVTIDAIALNDTSSNADLVTNGGQPELTFTGNGQLEFNGNDGITIDGTKYSLDTLESVDAGQTTTAELIEFEDTSGPGRGGDPVEMSGETITVTLYLETGEKYTETLTVGSSGSSATVGRIEVVAERLDPYGIE